MMKMINRNLDHWSYGLVYEEEAEEYIIAEIHFNTDGKAFAYCIAEIAAFNKQEIINILNIIKQEVESGDKYIWNGKELKHKIKEGKNVD